MNFSVGIYRIAKVIKWTSRVIGGLLILAMAYAYIFENGSKEGLGVALLVIVVYVALAEGIAWVLEGFAND